MRLSKREKVLIGILVILGVGYIIDHFMICPAATCHRQLLASEAGLENQMKQLENLTAEYGTEKQQEFVETNYRRVLAKIPPSAMVPNVIEYLQSSAADSGVRVINVSYLDTGSTEPNSDHRSQETPKTSAQQINFQIETEGEYGNILEFLQRIEDAPRLYMITKVKIVFPPNLPATSTASEITTNQSGIDQYNESSSTASDQISPADSKLFLEFNAYYLTLPD